MRDSRRNYAADVMEATSSSTSGPAQADGIDEAATPDRPAATPDLPPATPAAAGPELRPPSERTWSIVAVVALVAVVLVMLRPSAHAMTSTLPQNLGDPALNTWILAWQSHALTSHPSQWFGGNVFFPHGDALGYSELMLPAVPLYAVTFLTTDNPVLAHNVVLVALFLLCALATYALARYLRCSRVAAFVAACGFTFNAYSFAHLGHLQLLTAGFFPLALLACFRMFDRRRVRDGIAVGVVTAALVTACLYYGMIWLVLVAVVVGYDALRTRRDGRSWSSLVPSGTAAAVAGVLLAPIGVLYLHFQSSNGFVRPLAPEGGLDPSDLLAPAPGSYAYRTAAASAVGRPGSVEHTFFPGFTVLVLGAIGIVTLLALRRPAEPGERTLRRDEPTLERRRAWNLLVAAGFVALVLGIGPTFAGVPAPFRFFFRAVPGFDSIRIAARLAAPAFLVLALGAGRGLDWITGRVRYSGLIRLGAAALVLVELAAPIPRVQAARDPHETALYDDLRSLPDGALAELPAAGPGAGVAGVFVESERMLNEIGDWREHFNGTSGGWPQDYLAEAATLDTFPSAESIALIDKWDIRYLVLHVSADGTTPLTYSPAQAAQIVSGLPAGYSAHRVGDDVVVVRTP